MRHTRLMKNILLTTSICALLTTSVLAMEQKDTSDNAPKKDTEKEEKMADGENPFHNMPPEIITKIATHLDKKDVANMRQTDQRNKIIIDNKAQSLFGQGYDKEQGVKNPSALFKAKGMGNQDAREIFEMAEKSYKQLLTEKDPAIKFSLWMNLAKDGLFLLLSEDKQETFIQALYLLAKNDIQDARKVFFGLSKDMAKMTEGVQRTFIWRLYNLAEKKIEGFREAFLGLSKDLTNMEEGVQRWFIDRLYIFARDDIGDRKVFLELSNRIGEMTEGGQIEFIMHLYNLAEDKIEGARDAFFGLISQMDKMKPSVPEFYKKMLEELKKKK